ncbi:MAG: amidase [Anaerolineae bacterium]
MSNNELVYTSATSLAQAIRERKVSSAEVVAAHLDRIEAVNPSLNAIVQLASETARAQAKAADAALARGQLIGPLHGVPVTIKDALETAGLISTGGTLGRATYIPPQDAPVVARLRAAGAIILGLTNVPEMSYGYESDNLIYGRTNNPYDLARTAGGSSGGEAAIIAAGGSPLGLGGDFAGSIRVPAHFCGIAGLRPTPGRAPGTGYLPMLGGLVGMLSQNGPLARYVEDLSLMLPIIAGADGRDPRVVPMPLGDPSQVNLKNLKVAFYTENGIVPPTSETAGAVKAAAQVLAEAGLTVVEDRPPCLEQSTELFLALLSADGGAGMDMALQMAGTQQVHPALQGLLESMRPHALSAAEFMGLWYRWDMWRSVLLSFMERYDVILSPVCAYPAMPHGTTGQHLAAFSYVQTYSLTASPAVVVRAGVSPEGVPIGVQIVPRHWREDVALAVAQQIETALGGWQRPLI